MSVFASSDLLEEIVETTEEQEADLCSSGETVDECTGLPISDFVEEPEVKHHPVHHQPLPPSQPSTVSSATTSSSAAASAASSSSSSRSHKRSAASTSSNHVALNGSGGTSGGVTRAASRSHMEQEKRLRREIANSNERRRMQSINAGFQSLRTLLPHHEGEKLSKAAILQQTAEYIYQLEQQKTQLLSQNLQLKRLVDQHEGGDVPTKKRKSESQGVVVSLPVHVSESGDEGLGSMSPEPLSVANAEMAELKRQLERERLSRIHAEKQLRVLQSQLFPEGFREEQIIAYQPHEVIEHTNNVLQQELEDAMPGLQVVSVVSVPTVGSTQTVETSNADSDTPPLSPQPGCEIIVPSAGGCASSIVVSEDVKEVTVGDLLQIDSRPNSPKLVNFANVQVFTASSLDAQTDSTGSFSPGTVAYTATLPVVTATAAEFKASTSPQYISSPTRPFSPDCQDGSQQQRLPSVLEAAIKAEPKVEVERLPSPSNTLDDGTPQTRLYLANTSRQNLETIVEAIRHLEGDHLFSDEPAQDVPLALTNKQTTAAAAAAAAAAAVAGTSAPSTSSSSNQRLLHAEVTNFLQFHTAPPAQQPQPQQQATPAPSSTNSLVVATSATAAAVATTTTVAGVAAAAPTSQNQAQQRPGVIVVKHS